MILFVARLSRKGRKIGSFLSRKSQGLSPPPLPKRLCLAVDHFDLSGKEDDYCQMSVQYVPTNTKKNDDWASKNFEERMEMHNRVHPDNKCSADLFEPPGDPKALAFWLPRFACETRNTFGGRYPTMTIYSLLSGLQRRIRATNPDAPNFMDAKDPQFREMHTIIDTYFRELRGIGVGVDIKHTNVISSDEENKQWEESVLGAKMPESLFRAGFYYNGKSLCLRGGEEHRALKLSHIVRHRDPPLYVYTENG